MHDKKLRVRSKSNDSLLLCWIDRGGKGVSLITRSANASHQNLPFVHLCLSNIKPSYHFISRIKSFKLSNIIVRSPAISKYIYELICSFGNEGMSAY